ncbi:ribonuclease HII [Polynucleobacter sp. SHI8]|uniref:ribonuclease HII n=1 Tax=unclassified Polynucleobacter TaxID=2640945 RepID=UPI002492A573|nr:MULTISPECIES: ribonuclease HII [unclassified Polynucleobacter]BDW11157.1 ribonuclease HII [Polynucleobacter sp. SHI2]BDW13603.1 ribonuclease HII [Polynucleobacter sp. SHI8]
MELICGVDEAGRGPLVGNVLAGAVILNPARPIDGLKDSKKLSSQKREFLYQEIVNHALAWGVGQASPAEIDQLNILQATMLAMKRAVEHLILQYQITPTLLLIDGNRAPEIHIQTQTIVKGDAMQPCISAASILAKVTRDQEMMALHRQYPDYGFDQHMGYPTAQHLKKIAELGVIPGYRLTFGPIKKLISRDQHD